MAIGDPTHSAYYSCWNDSTNNYYAYMKVDGSFAEIQAFMDNIKLTANTEIDGTHTA